MQDSEPPGTTVVIATRNRAATLLPTLERIKLLPERPPIIVVDNASADGTPGLVAATHPDVRVVALPTNLGAAARNSGVALADTPLVAFSDDDSWWAPHALTAALRTARMHPEAALIAGRVLVGPDNRIDPVSTAMAASPLGERVLGFTACGAVVRREPFLAVGGFNHRFGIGGEEEMLALDLAAAGWTCIYAPEVIAHHHPGPRLGDDRRRRQVANSLLVAVLRRRALSAATLWWEAALQAPADPQVRAGLADAIRQFRWAANHRRPIANMLEREVLSMPAC